MSPGDWVDVVLGAFVLLNTVALASRVGDTITQHDDGALWEYEDLSRWARDALRAEADALDAHDLRMRERGIGGAGLAVQGERRIRDDFAQRWRDRKSASERSIRALHHLEHWPHRVYRQLIDRPWPANPHAEEVSIITAGWELRVSDQGGDVAA